MKITTKLAAVIVALGCALGANAQTEGRMFVGGAASFTSGNSSTTVGSSTTKGPETTSGEILPTFAYFLKDNVVLGISVGYAGETSKSTNSAGTTVTTSTSGSAVIMPFVRYVKTVGEKAAIWGQFEVNYNPGTDVSESVTGSTSTKTTIALGAFGANIRPGVTYYIADNFSIDAKYGRIGYNNNSASQTVGTTDIKAENNNFGLDLSMRSLAFGLHYYFGGK